MSWKDIINVGSAIKNIVVDDEKKEETEEEPNSGKYKEMRKQLWSVQNKLMHLTNEKELDRALDKYYSVMAINEPSEVLPSKIPASEVLQHIGMMATGFQFLDSEIEVGDLTSYSNRW